MHWYLFSLQIQEEWGNTYYMLRKKRKFSIMDRPVKDFQGSLGGIKGRRGLVHAPSLVLIFRIFMLFLLTIN